MSRRWLNFISFAVKSSYREWNQSFFVNRKSIEEIAGLLALNCARTIPPVIKSIPKIEDLFRSFEFVADFIEALVVRINQL